MASFNFKVYWTQESDRRKALNGTQRPCNYTSVIREMGVICLLHGRSCLLQGFLPTFRLATFLQTLAALVLLLGHPTLFTDKT